MAKFLIEVHEDGISHDEIVELLTGEDMTEGDGVEPLDADAVTVTPVVDSFELPSDAVYKEDEEAPNHDDDFPSDVKEDTDN